MAPRRNEKQGWRYQQQMAEADSAVLSLPPASGRLMRLASAAGAVFRSLAVTDDAQKGYELAASFLKSTAAEDDHPITAAAMLHCLSFLAMLRWLELPKFELHDLEKLAEASTWRMHPSAYCYIVTLLKWEELTADCLRTLPADLPDHVCQHLMASICDGKGLIMAALLPKMLDDLSDLCHLPPAASSLVAAALDEWFQKISAQSDCGPWEAHVRCAASISEFVRHEISKAAPCSILLRSMQILEGALSILADAVTDPTSGGHVDTTNRSISGYLQQLLEKLTEVFEAQMTLADRENQATFTAVCHLRGRLLMVMGHKVAEPSRAQTNQQRPGPSYISDGDLHSNAWNHIVLSSEGKCWECLCASRNHPAGPEASIGTVGSKLSSKFSDSSMEARIVALAAVSSLPGMVPLLSGPRPLQQDKPTSFAFRGSFLLAELLQRKLVAIAEGVSPSGDNCLAATLCSSFAAVSDAQEQATLAEALLESREFSRLRQLIHNQNLLQSLRTFAQRQLISISNRIGGTAPEHSMPSGKAIRSKLTDEDSRMAALAPFASLFPEDFLERFLGDAVKSSALQLPVLAVLQRFPSLCRITESHLCGVMPLPRVCEGGQDHHPGYQLPIAVRMLATRLCSELRSQRSPQTADACVRAWSHFVQGCADATLMQRSAILHGLVVPMLDSSIQELCRGNDFSAPTNNTPSGIGDGTHQSSSSNLQIELAMQIAIGLLLQKPEDDDMDSSCMLSTHFIKLLLKISDDVNGPLSRHSVAVVKIAQGVEERFHLAFGSEDKQRNDSTTTASACESLLGIVREASWISRLLFLKPLLASVTSLHLATKTRWDSDEEAEGLLKLAELWPPCLLNSITEASHLDSVAYEALLLVSRFPDAGHGFSPEWGHSPKCCFESRTEALAFLASRMAQMLAAASVPDFRRSMLAAVCKVMPQVSSSQAHELVAVAIPALLRGCVLCRMATDEVHAPTRGSTASVIDESALGIALTWDLCVRAVMVLLKLQLPEMASAVVRHLCSFALHVSKVDNLLPSANFLLILRMFRDAVALANKVHSSHTESRRALQVALLQLLEGIAANLDRHSKEELLQCTSSEDVCDSSVAGGDWFLKGSWLADSDATVRWLHTCISAAPDGVREPLQFVAARRLPNVPPSDHQSGASQ